MKVTSRDSEQVLRLPLGLRDQIKAAADLNGRTFNAEIVSRLSGDQKTLRDEFAIEALNAGLMGDHREWDDQRMLFYKVLAKQCYIIADAMLEARK